jgi:hypothetical protein
MADASVDTTVDTTRGFWITTVDGFLVDLAKATAIDIPPLPPVISPRDKREWFFVVRASFGASGCWDLARFDSREEAEAMIRALASSLGAADYQAFIHPGTVAEF